MRSLSGGCRRLAVPSAIVGAFAAAGIVYASIPDASGVIHGCYARIGGGLRVIDTGTGQRCNASRETPLSWNQSGPPGAPGPSDAYVVQGWRTVPGDYMQYTVASTSIPQGSFVVSAVIRLIAGGANAPYGVYVVCSTLFDGLPIFDGVGNVNIIRPNTNVTLPTLGVGAVRNATSTLTLDCQATGSDVTITTFMVATKIGTLHE